MEELNDTNTSLNVNNPTRAFDDGKDEMNLAEFPIAAISDRVPEGQKTLVFEDRKRRLTISASDKYGLPTSLDDEVVLGLIQLTKQNRFRERKVNFSRYQLIQVMGWRHEGRSYERLEKSLKRWLGVTLYYEKAWWDQDEQSYVDENFHILDNVTLYNQERRLKKLRGGSAEKPLSSFTWNEVVFRSFKSGWLKGLDLRIYRQLESSVAKRMFRFLDKRFYHRSLWEFDLREFACEHIGVAKTYDTGQLKRQLKGAIEELENVGFLEALPVEQRYIKIARGEWRIVFIHKVAIQIEDAPTEHEGLTKQLIERGVTASVAKTLVKEFSSEVIEKQIAAFDALPQTKRSILRNPAGFLVKSIRERYSSPPNSTASRPVSVVQQTATRNPNTDKRDPVSREVNAYLRSLGKEELASLEAQALKSATPFIVDGYYRSKEAGGPAHENYRSMLLESEAKRILESQNLKESELTIGSLS